MVERLLNRLLIFVLILPVLLVASCSSTKNTWRERAVQSLNTRFNVYFNGKKSYDEGLAAILQAHKDDYSKVIPMYPISDPASAKSATSQMTRAIEKSRKAIKTRSIKTKPEVNPSKRSDPNYRAFLQQEEYNPFMKEVWLLLAKAEFHKADFLGSIGTFNYIIRHFPTDTDLQTTARLWVIRAFAEMGWLYEAEEMVQKLNSDLIKNENTGLYAAVNADLLLKQKSYREAIPFLEMALKWEKDRKMKVRFSYLLAQLYELSGDRQKAYTLYSGVIDSNPPYEMDFNARISRAGLFISSTQEVRRELTKMIRNNNNKDYLDQLYNTIGLSYLHDKDTLQAIRNFEKGIEASSRNGLDKAGVLIRLADLRYLRKEYVKAQPAYDEASRIITVDNEEYPRVSKRAEMLSELVVEYQMVELQDSLQRLSAMTPEQRLETINNYIAWLEREEELAAEREAERIAREEENGQRLDPMAGMPQVGANQTNAWYFYNTSALRSGQTDFQRKWGKRKLEDNWRRKNKSAALFSETATADVQTNEQTADSTNTGNELPVVEETVAAGDRNSAEYYLRQIPVTPAQLEKSDELWADALFKMASIYKDKLEDFPMAIEAYEEYIRRFGKNPLASEALFSNYLIYHKLQQEAKAGQTRERLLNDYPQSSHAILLADPDFLKKRQQMFERQDSLYASTYKAFNENKFQRVRELTDSVQMLYPMSTLMPKFLFIKALSVAKSGSQQEFEAELTSLLEAHPQSDVSAMCKDMLALIRQGRESQQGSSHGTILARRDAELLETTSSDSINMNFSATREGPHRLILLSSASQENLFPLQFQLAVYNFSKFLIKDFEISIAFFNAEYNSVSVFDFEDYEEAEWYLQSIQEDEAVVQQLQELAPRALIVSSYNYGLLRSGKTLSEYEAFTAKEDTTEILTDK